MDAWPDRCEIKRGKLFFDLSFTFLEFVMERGGSCFLRTSLFQYKFKDCILVI